MKMPKRTMSSYNDIEDEQVKSVKTTEKQERKANALSSITKLLNVSEKYAGLWHKRFENIAISTDKRSKKAIQAPKIMMFEEEDLTTLKYFTGELRPYQVEGVQWMKTLYMGGINGILADEMGLGKTVQVIALLSHFLEHNLPGPHLIVAPLSTIPNWKSEFARFAPQFPVITFSGNIDVRQSLKLQITKKYLVDRKVTHPVVLITYQTVLSEFNFLSSVQWKYIIVDEAQRIKNPESKLGILLRKLRCANKLLLTGTPLQNNMIELWSLLNFIMPQIFSKLDMFSSLLVLEDMEDVIKEVEDNENLITKIHQVLAPFMLRRLKKDVLGDLVPKKEVLVYCPMTDLQRDVYSLILEKDAGMIMGTKEPEIDITLPRPKRLCTMRSRSQYRRHDFSESKQPVISYNTVTETDVNTEQPDLANNEYNMKNKESNKKEVEVFDEENVVEEEDFSDAEEEQKIIDEQEKRNQLAHENRLMREAERKRRKDTVNRPPTTWSHGLSAEYSYNITFQNRMMMYRKIVAHPYLIKMPVKPGTKQVIVDESFVTQSGKMLVLDAMLHKLKEQGHKVLIFSTLTMMLDIIEEYMLMRDYKYCRLDGSCSIERRAKDIDSFNKDPDILAFLVSTRAGGLGINLTAADTVILFDRDWNPQVDVQAEDRCHRIGQTRPVVVYSFVTKNTIDEIVIQCGIMKKRLEKLVIKDKKLDLVKMLASDVKHVIHPNGYVFSEEELNRLLDRTDLYEELERTRKAQKL